jgi:Uncharacterized conserved protein (DUF2304)
MNAELLMMIGGSTAFVLTIYLVRTRELREKYAVVWVIAASLLLLCGLFPRAIMALAEAGRLSYPSMVLFIALAAIYLFSLTVSVSLTHQYRRSVRLAQEVSVLECRVRQLEAERGREAGSPESGPSGQEAGTEETAGRCSPV